jgi:hypothetical protein
MWSRICQTFFPAALLSALLGCSDSKPREGSSQDTKSEMLNKILLHVFQEHNIEAKVDGISLSVKNGALKIMGLIVKEGQLNANLYLTQLDIQIKVEGVDEVIVESFAGFGATQKEAIAEALQNFMLSSFHVITAAFLQENDSNVTVETWKIGDQEKRVIIGNVTMRGNPPANFSESNWFSQLEEKIKASSKDLTGAHWVRLYCSQVDNAISDREILLDNEPWEELEKEIPNFSWPKGKDFYSARIFMILK